MTERNIQSFWDRLDTVRKKCGIRTLKDVCASLDIPYQTIANQRSQGRYPSVEYIIAFADRLDCSVDWLLNGQKIERLHMDGLSGEKIEALKVLLKA